MTRPLGCLDTQSSPNGAAGSPELKKLRVLIVDDNAEWAQIVRRVIERRLPDSSREVRWESTMKSAKEALLDFKPDVTLLDLEMADSTPEQTIEAIRLFNSQRAVFIVSAHVFAQDDAATDILLLECMKAGAENVYSKDSVSIMFLVRDIVITHMRHTFHHIYRKRQLQFETTNGQQPSGLN